jgi:hypothetical protein
MFRLIRAITMIGIAIALTQALGPTVGFEYKFWPTVAAMLGESLLTR